MRKGRWVVLVLALLLLAQPASCINEASILGLQELLEEGELESVVSISDAMLEAMRPEPPADIRWVCFAADGYRFLYESLYPGEVYDIIDYDVVNVLYMKAYAHSELGQYQLAIQALTEGLVWDPIGLQLRFELLHNYRQLDMEEALLAEQQAIWSLLLYPEDFARFYRYLGGTLVDDGEWNTARRYLLASLRFEDSAAVRNELSYIGAEDLVEGLAQADTREMLIADAETLVADDGWGFSLDASQRAALQRQGDQETAAGQTNGAATQSLALYNGLLPALPPPAETLP